MTPASSPGRYLYELGLKQDELWGNYLKALAERGLSREPARRG